MNKEYTKELKELKDKMIKAEKLADKVPCLSKEILDRKITGEEVYIKIAERYKTMPLRWGINRGLFDSTTSRYITNYGKNHKGYYFSIYVNTTSLFDTHFSVHEVAEKVPVFYYDYRNSNFYATDEQICGLLEALHEWYLAKVVEVNKLNQQKRIEKAKADIEKAEAELGKLTDSNI